MTLFENRPAAFGAPGYAIDPWPAALAAIPEGFYAAREARDRAEHYNGFNVGSFAVACNEEGSIGEFTGANRNLYPGSNPTKKCSEQAVFEEVISQHQDRLLLVATSGPVQPDTQSRLVTPTLHTCGECRGEALKLDIVKWDSLLCTVSPDEDSVEVYTYANYLQMHDGGVLPSEFNHRIDPGFKLLSGGLERYLELRQYNPPSGILAMKALLALAV